MKIFVNFQSSVLRFLKYLLRDVSKCKDKNSH